MKRIIRYFLGLEQFLPFWAYEVIPDWFLPIYDGKIKKFIWLGMKFNCEGCKAGETLFMYWNRKLAK